MRENKFRIQVVCVLALIALVSWPQFKPIKEQATVWRANPLEVRTQASSNEYTVAILVGLEHRGITRAIHQPTDRASRMPGIVHQDRRQRSALVVLPVVHAAVPVGIHLDAGQA